MSASQERIKAAIREVLIGQLKQVPFAERVEIVEEIGLVPAWCPGCLCTLGSPDCHPVPEVNPDQVQQAESCPEGMSCPLNSDDPDVLAEQADIAREAQARAAWDRSATEIGYTVMGIPPGDPRRASATHEYGNH